jgi:hypothetical protein
MTTNPERYARGGDIHLMIATNYGNDAAERASRAAFANDGGASLRALLSDLKRGNTSGDFNTTGTLGNFWTQLTTDPFAAPLESANRHLGNVISGLFRNPLVLLLIVGVVAWKLGLLEKLLRKVRS